MGKILEAFAEEQLHVVPPEAIRTPKHQKLCDKMCEFQEKLEEKLNNEEKKFLNEFYSKFGKF